MEGHVGFTHILMFILSNMLINEEVLISNKLHAIHLRLFVYTIHNINFLYKLFNCFLYLKTNHVL